MAEWSNRGEIKDWNAVFDSNCFEEDCSIICPTNLCPFPIRMGVLKEFFFSVYFFYIYRKPGGHSSTREFYFDFEYKAK